MILPRPNPVEIAASPNIRKTNHQNEEKDRHIDHRNSHHFFTIFGNRHRVLVRRRLLRSILTRRHRQRWFRYAKLRKRRSRLRLQHELPTFNRHLVIAIRCGFTH